MKTLATDICFNSYYSNLMTCNINDTFDEPIATSHAIVNCDCKVNRNVERLRYCMKVKEKYCQFIKI